MPTIKPNFFSCCRRGPNGAVGPTGPAGPSGADAISSAIASATGNVVLVGGAPNITDGVSLSLNDRVVVPFQTDHTENGVYVVTDLGTGANGTWTRSTDANTSAVFANWFTIYVRRGTLHGASHWLFGSFTEAFILGASNVMVGQVPGIGLAAPDNTVASALTSRSFIGAGQSNTISGDFGFIGAGQNNLVDADWGAVAGGYENTASYVGFVGGGGYNVAYNYSAIGGGAANTSSSFGFIGGGRGNTITGAYSAIGGGYNNSASNIVATIGGGGYNVASGPYAVVGGGKENTAGAQFATVSGGTNNSVTGVAGAVVGGFNNAAFSSAVVTGGHDNAASGHLSSVCGGNLNEASGQLSSASGYRAKATHEGSWVWADYQVADFGSSTNNQWSARAENGFRFALDSTPTYWATLDTVAAFQTALSLRCDVGAGTVFRRVKVSPDTDVNGDNFLVVTA